jgi:hypothetical protein
MTGPPARRAGDAAPRVLLISRAGDVELNAVAALLARAGIGCLRLDAEGLANLSLAVEPEAGVLRIGECELTPTVTWIRHFSSQAIEAAGSGIQQQFLQDSWQALVTQLDSVSGTVLTAPGTPQLSQLRIASRVGMRVPRTIVATDLSHARDALQTDRLVLKSVAGHFVEGAAGRLTGVFPEVVERAGLSARHGPAVPIMAQEYVDHASEMRVYYIRGEIHGFEIVKAAAADLWLRPEQVSAVCAAVPAGHRAAIARLARALNLEFAAMDFLLDGQELVFLEANPDGDWAWIEAMTGTTAVTMSVARMLADLHGEQARPGHAAAGREFSLPLFLT